MTSGTRWRQRLCVRLLVLVGFKMIAPFASHFVCNMWEWTCVGMNLMLVLGPVKVWSCLRFLLKHDFDSARACWHIVLWKGHNLWFHLTHTVYFGHSVIVAVGMLCVRVVCHCASDVWCECGCWHAVCEICVPLCFWCLVWLWLLACRVCVCVCEICVPLCCWCLVLKDLKVSEWWVTILSWGHLAHRTSSHYMFGCATICDCEWMWALQCLEFWNYLVAHCHAFSPHTYARILM